ncbi:MAG: NUDIX hydrolase [Firmicutes bacterium]|nr:NUDIX hydrolase [Bacillota bacterium]
MEQDTLYERALLKKEVFKGHLISVEHWQAEVHGGHVALREIVKHVGAAAVVPMDAEGNVTLVTQYRIAMGRVMLEIPAGKKDCAQEDPLACAKRELSEETGLTAANWHYLTTIDTSPGFLTERIGLYMATGLSEGETHPDEDEFLGLVRMPLREAVSKVMEGKITDAKTIVGLMMAWKAAGAL